VTPLTNRKSTTRQFRFGQEFAPSKLLVHLVVSQAGPILTNLNNSSKSLLLKWARKQLECGIKNLTRLINKVSWQQDRRGLRCPENAQPKQRKISAISSRGGRGTPRCEYYSENEKID
jgi:hypothetical protein